MFKRKEKVPDINQELSRLIKKEIDLRNEYQKWRNIEDQKIMEKQIDLHNIKREYQDRLHAFNYEISVIVQEVEVNKIIINMMKI